MIVGNSVGEDFFKIFYLNKELFKNYAFELISPKIRKRNSVYQVKCLEQLIRQNITKCENFEFTANILDQFKKSEIIILSTLWTEEDLVALDTLIPLIYSRNKKIILTNKSIFMNVYTANEFNPLDYYVYSNKKFPDKKKLNNILNNKAKKFDIPFLNLEKFQCNYKNKTCDLVTPDNYKIYWDRTHITEKGARYLGNKIYELNWFMID